VADLLDDVRDDIAQKSAVAAADRPINGTVRPMVPRVRGLD